MARLSHGGRFSTEAQRQGERDHGHRQKGVGQGDAIGLAATAEKRQPASATALPVSTDRVEPTTGGVATAVDSAAPIAADGPVRTPAAPSRAGT